MVTARFRRPSSKCNNFAGERDHNRERHTLKGHTDAVWTVAFSPNGKHLLTGAFDNTARLWDVESRELFVFRDQEGGIISAAFSQDGKLAATSSLDRTVKLWAPETGEEFLTLRGHRTPVASVRFTPDGKRFITPDLEVSCKCTPSTWTPC